MARVLTDPSWLVRLGLLLLVSCSVVLGSPPTGQCSSDADCERSPALQGRSCDVQYGVCVEKEQNALLVADGCESSERCTEESSARSLCRVRGTPCIPLETADCRWVEGQWQAANALFIGTIGAHTLLQANGSPVPLPWTGRAMRVMDLGLSEWNATLLGGLSASGSPLAIVHCNSNGDPAQLARALEHLTSTVRVKALIAMGDVELSAIGNTATDADIPVLCAACSERAERASSSGVASWRMLPPLADQALLAAWRVSDLEQRIRSDRSLAAGAPIRVALLGQENSPGNEAFVAGVRGELRFNELAVAGQSEASYLQRNVPDPTRQSVDALGISRELIAFQPDILIAGLDADFSSVYLAMIEQQWPVEQPRPSYILSVQNRDLGLLEAIGRSSTDLHLRVSGTAPLSSAQVLQNRKELAVRYQRAQQEPPEETQGAYDALYATAYAFYVADLERRYDTTRFARGLAQLTVGPGINVGPDRIMTGVGYLLNEETFDLVGSASELDWDLASGGVSADATLWCLHRDEQGSLSVKEDAGVHWARATGRVSGTYTCP